MVRLRRGQVAATTGTLSDIWQLSDVTLAGHLVFMPQSYTGGIRQWCDPPVCLSVCPILVGEYRLAARYLVGKVCSVGAL